MNKQATKKLSPAPVSTPTKPETENPTTTEKYKTNLGKRKKSGSEPEGNFDALDDLDSVILSGARNKIQKVSHSNKIDGESTEIESVDKMKTEMVQVSFVQTKMACACGYDHTITLSDDGTLHSFGYNRKGQLGLGHNNDVSLPTPIPNLPKMNMVSCGGFFTLPKITQISCGGLFTVCVDHEGYIWSFGENNSGQLGTGNTTDLNVPQKILNIPPVHSVSCGYDYTLIITDDDNLWSCGGNHLGQLCHGDKEARSNPQKTSFSNISNISAGCYHSLFQNNKGEIFSCGFNEYGQCGLGHFNENEITPSLIPNLPSNIVHFVCGNHQSLFLDSEGNVFSVGDNEEGQLGLGHNTNQNVLNKIPNIPPIKTISCVSRSCYLIDFEGNLWSFGFNLYGQLGHGDEKNINTPKIINTLKDIQQISYGSCGYHFFAKNSQNQIFVTGANNYGQLGTGDTTEPVSTPKEIHHQYSTIWSDEFRSRAKSARK